MNLLTKFETVEIKADTRISETDRNFCAAHQAAYESARTSLAELGFIWNDMLNQQSELLTPTGASSETYLVTYDALKLSDYAIQQQIHSLHPQFISQIVSYFSKTYHFSINTNEITYNLIPQKPADRWKDNYKELIEKYMKDMDELSLSYTDVLEQIFLQTGGRAFFEQALHELKEKCHQAAWITSNGKPRFEQKKAPYSSPVMPAVSETGMAEASGNCQAEQKIFYGALPILKQGCLAPSPAACQGFSADMILLTASMNFPTAKSCSPCGCSKTAG